MKDKISTRAAGNIGENMAADHLESAGYKILCRNYTVRGGEIDIIALDGTTLVFVEVKTRKNDLFGKACEAVTKKKTQHIISAAERYIFENPAYGDMLARFDVIEVYTQNGFINHIKNIDIN